MVKCSDNEYSEMNKGDSYALLRNIDRLFNLILFPLVESENKINCSDVYSEYRKGWES